MNCNGRYSNFNPDSCKNSILGIARFKEKYKPFQNNIKSNGNHQFVQLDNIEMKTLDEYIMQESL